MTSHTPGPWRIGDAGNTIFGPPNGTPSPATVASVGAAGKDLEAKKANARLIAAAPDMLAALINAKGWLDPSSEAARMAAAAIAKAEGR